MTIDDLVRAPPGLLAAEAFGAAMDHTVATAAYPIRIGHQQGPTIGWRASIAADAGE